MAFFDWIKTLDDLSPAALTLIAQAVDPLDREDLNLFLEFFPFADVDSIRLSEISDLDFRPVADRREWNAPGRRIPMKTPDFKNLEMNPIEAEFVYDEKAIQRLMERVEGNAALVRQIIGAEIPQRVDVITDSVWRRLLVDAFKAWSLGIVTMMNPQDGVTTSTSFQIATDRYVAAPTAWNDAGVNAFDLLLSFMDTAETKMGSVKGVIMRRATQNEILKDAPAQSLGVRMTRGELAERISSELGMPFEFRIIEETVDLFTDGGTATTETKLWPAQVIAAIPQGGAVGRTARAPVYRAGDVAGVTPASATPGVDNRGVSIYPEARNSGKELCVQGQMNAMPLPNEQKIYVANVGV